jgi:hypothetical protein
VDDSGKPKIKQQVLDDAKAMKEKGVDHEDYDPTIAEPDVLDHANFEPTIFSNSETEANKVVYKKVIANVDGA